LDSLVWPCSIWCANLHQFCWTTLFLLLLILWISIISVAYTYILIHNRFTASVVKSKWNSVSYSNDKLRLIINFFRCSILLLLSGLYMWVTPLFNMNFLRYFSVPKHVFRSIIQKWPKPVQWYIIKTRSKLLKNYKIKTSDCSVIVILVISIFIIICDNINHFTVFLHSNKTTSW